MTRRVAVVAFGVAVWSAVPGWSQAPTSFLSSLVSASSPAPQQPPVRSGQVRAGVPDGGAAYSTRIETESGRVLRLRNGAVIEITSGSVGALGVRKDAVLLVSGTSCRVWIAGTRTLRCSVLTEPSTKSVDFVLTFIAHVSSGGESIGTRDGAVYEVTSRQTTHTALWQPAAEVAVVDGSQMLNLDQGDEIISVVRLK